MRLLFPKPGVFGTTKSFLAKAEARRLHLSQMSYYIQNILLISNSQGYTIDNRSTNKSKFDQAKNVATSPKPSCWVEGVDTVHAMHITST